MSDLREMIEALACEWGMDDPALCLAIPPACPACALKLVVRDNDGERRRIVATKQIHEALIVSPAGCLHPRYQKSTCEIAAEAVS